MDRADLIEALKRFALSDEVAELTGIPQQHVPTYMKRGKLPQPIGKLGRYHVWDREELLEWIKNNPPRKNAEE